MGIQLGIVGYGGMGGFHHRNASKIEGVQVVGAYDIDPVRVQVAEESGLRGFSSLEDLLACEDINTVLVAVPNDCHMEICIAASNAGKHVICEKPAALNVDELDQMIAAAGRNGKLFTVHQNRRWDKDFRIVKDILDSGELGKVYSIQSRLHGSGGVMFGWRGEKKHGGGMLYDWGVHFIDQLMWIRKVGTITPALARPLPDGGYELISGHRRLAACQVLGIETMPVIVREMSDDEAVIAMVDANLQRETILPSEKAFAYKMKLDAIKHQGVTSRQLGEKLLSITQVSKDSDDSERQIQRYIRLTCLIPELLSMVDDKKIAFNPAVEISYLDRDEQLTLLDAINMNDCTPSHAQSIRLKKMSQDGLLTADAIYAILSEEKPNQKEQIKLPRDELRKYFPQNYSDKQIKRDILKGLELLKRQRERNRDAR